MRVPLLFWHKIILLSITSIMGVVLCIAFATWNVLDKAGERINTQCHMVFSQQHQHQLHEMVKQQAQVLDERLDKIQLILTSSASWISHLADDSPNLLPDKLIQKVLTQLYENIDNCNMVFYVRWDGQMITFPSLDKEGSDERRAFYRFLTAKNQDFSQKVWRKIYHYSATSSYELIMGCTIDSGLESSSKGMIGVGVSVPELIQKVNENPIFRDCYLFIMDKYLKVLFVPPHLRKLFSQKMDIPARSVVSCITGNSNLDMILSQMALGDSGIQPMTNQKMRGYIAYHPLSKIDWELGMIISDQMIVDASYRFGDIINDTTTTAMDAMWYWVGWLLLLALVGGIILARQLTLPIREISRATLDIAQGNFKRRVNVKSRDEMGLLGLTFNAMAKRIQNMIVDLNRINSELNQKNAELKSEIRQHQKTVQQLEESEERFRSLSENSPDIIFTLDTKGRFSYINPAFEILLGYPIEATLGYPMEVFARESDKALCCRMISRIRRDQITVRDATIRFIHQDGREMVFNISCAPKINSDGLTTGMVGVCKDMTEIRRLEAQLHHALKMEAIGTLAGGIAHDFNNLLMGILGNVTLLRMATDPNDPKHQKLVNIEQQVERGSNLTRQILGFARGGKYEVKPSDIHQLIRQSTELFGRTKKEVTITYKFANHLPAVEIDQGQIEQVLINLYVNAWQAMPGGGEISISTESVMLDNEYVKPYGLQGGTYVRIAVSDTGIGMDLETKQKIFEPFFTTREIGDGTGLGLASSYGIIQHHGGFIEVESKKGKGSTFTLYLPASNKSAEITSMGKETLYKGSGTILLVDDEHMILDTGADLLKTLGYEVIVAQNGKQALDLFAVYKNKVDLVILDMIMPEIGGREVFHALREMNPELKVLLSSGYSIEGQAKEIMDQGCNGFIQKPFNIEQLSIKLANILSNSRDIDLDPG